MAAKKPKKKQSIRNSEYYNTQECFDQLYQDSLHGKRFTHQLIHATEEETLRKYLDRLKSCKLNMPRLNKLRELAGNCKIVHR